jgi:hypothetical protein
MKNSPETNMDATTEPGITRPRGSRTVTLLATAAALALSAATGCTDKASEEAHQKLEARATATAKAKAEEAQKAAADERAETRKALTNIAEGLAALNAKVTAPAAAAQTAATSTEAAATGMTSSEYMTKWCGESSTGKADKSGENLPYGIVIGEDKKVRVVELCGDKGVAEVKPVVCGEQTYVTATTGEKTASYALGNISKPQTPFAKLDSKVPHAEGNVPTIEADGLDGKKFQLPEDTLIGDAVRVPKIPCETKAATSTAPAATSTPKTVEKSKGNFVTVDTFGGLEKRVTGLETRVTTVETTQAEMQTRLASVLAYQPGTCVDYKTTPADCKRLEQTRQHSAASAEKK